MEDSNAPPDTLTAPSTEDLIMKLSAELRNKIYEASLKTEGTTYISRRGRWEEPALLRASRQIRFEALPLYYHANSFKAYVQTEQVAQFVVWLEGIQSKCSNKLPFASFEVSFCGNYGIITGSHQFLPLAEFLRTTEEEVFKNDRSGREAFPSWVGSTNTFAFISTFLSQIIKLGYQAKEKKWSAQQLAEKYDEMVVKKKTTKAYRDYIMAARRQAQASQRLSLTHRLKRQTAKRDKHQAELDTAERALEEIRREVEELDAELNQDL